MTKGITIFKVLFLTELIFSMLFAMTILSHPALFTHLELTDCAQNANIAIGGYNANCNVPEFQASKCESEAVRMEAGVMHPRQRTQVAPAVLPR